MLRPVLFCLFIIVGYEECWDTVSRPSGNFVFLLSSQLGCFVFEKQNTKQSLGQKEKSPVSSVDFKIGVRWWAFYVSNRAIRDAGIYAATKFPISNVQSIVANRGLTNLTNVHTPMWISRIPIDPAILAAIEHRFIAKKKIIKNANALIWGDTRGDQKPETFLGGGPQQLSWGHDFFSWHFLILFYLILYLFSHSMKRN